MSVERLSESSAADLAGLVLARRDAGDLDGALEAAQSLVERRPRDARAWRLCGELLRAAGRRDDAAGALERAVRLDDHDLEAAVLLSELYVDRGWDEAGAALANFVVLHERGAPELRARAQKIVGAAVIPARGSES